MNKIFNYYVILCPNEGSSFKIEEENEDDEEEVSHGEEYFEERDEEDILPNAEEEAVRVADEETLATTKMMQLLERQQATYTMGHIAVPTTPFSDTIRKFPHDIMDSDF